MALNKVVEMGRLVADPELRTVGDNVSVCSFRIAVDRDRKNKDGEREADFFSVVAWRAAGEFVAKYFQKGDMIVVDGRLQSRTYQDKDGNNRAVVEIVAENCYFGSGKKDGGQYEDKGNTYAVNTKNQPNYAEIAEEDGELPF